MLYVINPCMQKGIIPNLCLYFQLNPEGLRKQMAWLKQQYGDLEIMITENGLPTYDGLNDTTRVDFYKSHLEQVSDKLLNNYRCPCKGWTRAPVS